MTGIMGALLRWVLWGVDKMSIMGVNKVGIMGG